MILDIYGHFQQFINPIKTTKFKWKSPDSLINELTSEPLPPFPNPFVGVWKFRNLTKVSGNNPMSAVLRYMVTCQRS